jgi:hypothetical protein
MGVMVTIIGVLVLIGIVGRGLSEQIGLVLSGVRSVKMHRSRW